MTQLLAHDQVAAIRNYPRHQEPVRLIPPIFFCSRDGRTPAKEIHLFDGDKFKHAFKAPGATSIEEMEKLRTRLSTFFSKFAVCLPLEIRYIVK